MNEDQDGIVYDDTPPEAAVNPDLAATAALTPEQEREIATRYAVRTGEFVPSSMLQERQQQQEPQQQQQPYNPVLGAPPEADQFSTYEEYFRADRAYRQAELAAYGERVAQQVIGALAPTLSPLIAQSKAADYGHLPQELQPHVLAILRENPDWAMSGGPAVKNAVEQMAYGRAYQAGALQSPSRQQGTIPSQRSGVAGPMRVSPNVHAEIDKLDQFRQDSGLPPMTMAERIQVAREIQNNG